MGSWWIRGSGLVVLEQAWPLVFGWLALGDSGLAGHGGGYSQDVVCFLWLLLLIVLIAIRAVVFLLAVCVVSVVCVSFPCSVLGRYFGLAAVVAVWGV